MDVQKVTQVYQQTVSGVENQTNGSESVKPDGPISAGQTAQLTKELLANLKPGQIFSGEITDIRNNMLEITLDNQQAILAKLTDSLEYVIGQKAIFQVKENSGNILTLTPYGGAAFVSKQLESQAITRALTQAELPVTDKTIELVKNLMEGQQPIDRQTLQQYGRLMVQFPNSDVNTLVTLMKFKIPVTAENINQFQNYKNNEYQLLKDIQSLSGSMTELVTHSLKEEEGVAKTLFQNLVGAIFDTKKGEKNQTVDLTQPFVEQKKEQGIELPQYREPSKEVAGRQELAALLREAGDYPELQNAILDENTPPEQIVKFLADAWMKQGFPKEHLSNILQNDNFRSILNSALERKMLITPDELLRPDGAENFYKSLVEKVSNIQKIAQEFSQGNSDFSKTASDMNQNLKFMQNLNEMMTYIQLPLRLTEQEAHGDLYVYTKKNLLSKKDGELSAMLHLDMEHLGTVDVMIRMKESHVTTNFTLETEELLDFIEEHMDLLTERLKKKGYDFHPTVKQKEEGEKHDFVEDFLKKEDPPVDVKRYSFDVRA